MDSNQEEPYINEVYSMERIIPVTKNIFYKTTFTSPGKQKIT